jgi:serine/threonine protein kinase
MSRIGGRFVLERQIGSGGMSTVYLGHDEVLDRPVAVKVLKSGFEDSEIAARFRREGRTAARLAHPNIVQVYDAGEGELDGRKTSYIVMEHISGGDLKQLIEEKGSLSGEEVARIGAAVAAGLAHAHERGVVHRDVKPHNILLDEGGRPKLADFGIARALDATQATRTGSYLGTALYSSPEQLKGERATPESDVYSLGVVLYEAVVGEPPFRGSPIEVASQQTTKAPRPPRAGGVEIRRDLEKLILSCMEKDPGRRPSAEDLRERLLKIGAGGSGPSGELAALALEKARKAGTSVLTAVRQRMSREESGGQVLPEVTISLPGGDSRPNRKQLAALLALAVVLAVVFFAGMSALLGANDRETATGNTSNRQQGSGPSGQDGGNESTDDPRDSSSSDASRGSKESTKQEKRERSSEETNEEPTGPPPPAAEAENAVLDMYVSAVRNDYERSWGYLSERYQNEVGSLEKWERRQSSLSSVYFSPVPSAQVEGRKATVSFTAQVSRSGAARQVRGAWICIPEDGTWKLDRFVRR